MKKQSLFLIIAGLVLLLLLVLAALKFYKSNSFYSSLTDSCNSDGCCLASVQLMEENGYRPSPNQSLTEHGCEDGYEAGALKCPSTYYWCFPEGNEY